MRTSLDVGVGKKKHSGGIRTETTKYLVFQGCKSEEYFLGARRFIRKATLQYPGRNKFSMTECLLEKV
jgi:hypothetical protein